MLGGVSSGAVCEAEDDSATFFHPSQYLPGLASAQIGGGWDGGKSADAINGQFFLLFYLVSRSRFRQLCSGWAAH